MSDRSAEDGWRTPFWADNVLALRHGAQSPQVYGELARSIIEEKLRKRPDLASYPEALVAWGVAEAQVNLLRRHYDRVGFIDPVKDEPRPHERLLALERHAARMRELLGLDPRAEASLSRERASAAALAVDLEEFARRGREALRTQVEQDFVGEALEKVQEADTRRRLHADLQHLGLPAPEPTLDDLL